VAALADDVADALADATTPPAQREGVFRLARFLIPDAIDAAFRKGRLPDVPVPASWDALRAHPLGRELLSLSVSNESLERAITRGDQQQLGIALKLLVDRARLHPEVAGAAEPWLRPLLTDERPLPRGGVVATLAEPLYRAALGALENKRVRELLPVAIARSLAPVHGVSPGFWSYYDDASRIHVRKSTILKVLLELLGDPEVLPAIRVRAREVLDRGPADQAVVEARRDANDIVLQILRDPHESAEVRDAMRSQLSVWMPKRISELRGNVIKRVSSLPNLDELRRDHGERLDANLRELSLQTELSQIERLVAQGRPDERDQIATALELVPHVVTWREDALSSLEAAVRTRLDDASWPEPSRVAAIYSRLLLDIAESGSGMPDLEDVLDVVSNLSADSLEPATWIDLLDRLGEVYAEDRVPSWLTLRATDPQTAAPVRFAAFKALCRRTGLAPELRAGIGISAAAAETDLTERARIVGLLCNAHPKLAIQAAEAGRLPAIHLPDIAWLYHAWDDGPADRRPGRVDVASRLVPPSEVIDALRAADRLDHTLAALELVPVAIEAEPELRADAIEALFRRLSDNRYVSAPSSNHRWHVMPTALDRYLDLVREDPTRTERALLAILDRTETAQFAVRCFRRGIRDHWIQMMGSLFDAAVGPHETPARRLGAWIALAEAGASQHEAAAQLAAAATRVTPALRGLLREAETPAEVRAEARKHPRARALL
jgi:hypothetical protein